MHNSLVKLIRFFSSATFLFISVGQLSAASGFFTQAKSVSGRTMDAIPGQVLVRYKSGSKASAQNQIFKSFGTRAKRRIDAIDVDILHVPPGESIDSFIEKLKTNPDIEFAEPNGIYRAFTAPNDTLYSSQYYLQSDLLNVEAAWDITTGVSSIVVAVIDTGVLFTHPDLSANAWVNPSTSPTSGLHGARMMIDWNEDGDGNDGDPNPAKCTGPEQTASDDPTDDNDPLDSCPGDYHGTHVSGIIAATFNNSTGIAGIAPNVRIMGVKTLNAYGKGSFDSIAQGIIYAVDHGASIINMSLGGEDNSSTVLSAVDYAMQKNVVVVAAAGTLGQSQTPPCAINYPAAISRVIAVGATNSSDQLAYFSCTGSQLDLVAPGVGIISLTAPATTSSEDGTSFSAPMVSGVAALIRSLDPNMSVDNVTRAIDFTATDLGPGGYDTNFGFGRLDAFKAVQAANNHTLFTSNPGFSGETFPYPNPYNPTTGRPLTIALPSSLGSQGLEIKIMNVGGETIKTLSGTNSWDGLNEDGNYVASGLYFYFAKTSKGDTKGKLTVLK